MLDAIRSIFIADDGSGRNILQKYGWHLVFTFIAIYYLRENGKKWLNFDEYMNEWLWRLRRGGGIHVCDWNRLSGFFKNQFLNLKNPSNNSINRIHIFKYLSVLDPFLRKMSYQKSYKDATRPGRVLTLRDKMEITREEQQKKVRTIPSPFRVS